MRYIDLWDLDATENCAIVKTDGTVLELVRRLGQTGERPYSVDERRAFKENADDGRNKIRDLVAWFDTAHLLIDQNILPANILLHLPDTSVARAAKLYLLMRQNGTSRPWKAQDPNLAQWRAQIGPQCLHDAVVIAFAIEVYSHIM